ncbi:MAG: hypothetical protein K2Y31_14315 [Burkholderiales bacterium]|jgi:hypothetical protein|nr:hypothetical protein [Burkholderiales bacterium]
MATPAQGIARLGFRIWYERQLIEGHVWFVTGFLCAVLIMALMEELNLRGPGPLSLSSLVIIVAASWLGIVAIRRYIRMLGRAESLAEQCVCPACACYGLIRVLEAGVAETDEHPQRMRVSCKRCDQQWHVESI